MTFVFTSDVDFVSDDIIEFAYKPFESLPLTVFITGESKYLAKAFTQNHLWEAEPHPNFCYGSTHGSSQREVFETINKFHCERYGVRCHRYYSSNDIEEEFARLGYGYLSNVCTDIQEVKPFWTRCGMLQIPIYFEDGGYLKYHGMPKLDDIVGNMQNDGVYVFNFHPIHIALNSCDFTASRQLKDSILPSEYSRLTMADVAPYRNNEYGIADFIDELIAYARKYKIKLMNLKQYYEECKSNRI